MDEPMTMKKLKSMVEKEVREHLAQNPEDYCREEVPGEVADALTPVYNHQLFEVLMSDTSLWYAESETGMGESDATPVSITQAVVYDALRDHAEDIIRLIDEEDEIAYETMMDHRAELRKEQRGY